MPNKYTDQQMIWVAQITYLDFDETKFNEWVNKYKDYPTVRQLLLLEAGLSEEQILNGGGLKTDDPAREEAYKVLYNYDPDKAAVIDPNLGEIADEGTRTNIEFINALLGINYQEVSEEYRDKIGEVWDIKGNEMLNAEGVLTPDVIVDGGLDC